MNDYFEDDAPIELTETDILEEPVTSASAKLDQVLVQESLEKEKRLARIKEKPPALKLTKKQKPSRKFKDKDYIIIHCNLCDNDYQHAKKDDEGNFEPFALCQHVVFKGAVIEE